MTESEQMFFQAYTFGVLVAAVVAVLVLALVLRRRTCPHPAGKRVATFDEHGLRVGYRCDRCREHLPTLFRTEPVRQRVGEL